MERPSEISKLLYVVHVLQVTFTVSACIIYTFGYSAEGFEYSSYNGIGTWMAILAIALSLTVLLLHHYRRIYTIRTYLSIGIVFALYSLLFLAPVANGYHINGRGSDDVLVHLGTVKHILNTGALSGDNWYPIIHILTAELHFFSIKLRFAVPILSLVVFLIFTQFLPLLVRAGLGTRYALPTFIVAAIPIFMKFHTTFHPVILSTMYLPVVMFVLVKTRSPVRSGLLLLPTITAVIFFHPSTTLLVLFPVLLLSALFSLIDRYRSMYLVGYLLVFILTWYSATERWASQVRVGAGIIFGGVQSAVSQQTQQIAATDPTLVELFVGFVTRYGTIWLYGTVASLYVIYAVLHYREVTRFELWSVSNFLVGAISGTAFLFITLFGRNPVRIAKYAALFSVILVGFSYVKLTASSNPGLVKKTSAVLLVLLVFSAAFVSVPRFYPEGDQFTATEDEGTRWLYQFSESDADALSLETGDDTLQYYSTGRKQLFGTISENNPPNRLHNVSQADADYFVSKGYDVYLYERFIKDENEEFRHYTPADLEAKVVGSYETNKVYSNGEYLIWKLRN